MKKRSVNAAASRPVTAARPTRSSSSIAADYVDDPEALMRIAPPRTVARLGCARRAHREVFTAVLGGAMRSRASCGDLNAAAFRGVEAAPTEAAEESRLDSRSHRRLRVAAGQPLLQGGAAAANKTALAV